MIAQSLTSQSGPSLLTRFWLRRGAAQSDAARCWICGVPAPQPVAKDVFRCTVCQRVQGDGVAEFLAAERRRELSRVPVEARFERAAALLAEAELALTASEDELRTALQVELQLESNDARKEDARSRVASALLGVGQVARALNDAALLLNPDGGATIDHEVPGARASGRAGAGAALRQVANLWEQRSRLVAELNQRRA
ncbi:MAG TPA: hypothetical protein VGC79_08855 [Polyangiaceae bacterium]